MASSPTGSAANGLNLLGGAVGLAGGLITSTQGKQDKSISGGQEDPALAAMRKRFAAQNAQTAMSVAASQQGVNPALAQRNAQQALGQQQVQTNAALAQGGLQSTLASRAATRGQQHQQIAGTALGLGQGLVGMGTSMGAQKAYESAGGLDAPPSFDASTDPAFAAQSQALSPETGGGLSAPPQGMAALTPGAPPVSPAPAMAQGPSPMGQMQTQGGQPQVMGMPQPQAMATPQIQEQAVGQASPEAAAFQATLPTGGLNPPVPQGPAPAGQMQMQGNSPQVTAQSAPMQAQGAPAAQTQQVQEQSVAQPGPAQAPPQAAPAPQEVALSTTQRVQMLSPEVRNDPMNSSIDQAAANAEARGNTEMAEILRRALLQRAAGGN
jgi:hypothetical protein